MYFREKENTNIDSEFKQEKKINIKPILIIAGIVIVLGIVIFAIISLSNNNKYIIKLTGEQEIKVPLGNDYVEPGYVAYDKKQNDVTNQVEVTSNIDTTKVGEYKIWYTIGNTKKFRTVIVSEIESITYIRLEGKINMNLKVGEKYKEPGYKAYDSTGEDITPNVKVSGSVNTSKEGTYIITYTVVNSKNIETTATRTIVVSSK